MAENSIYESFMKKYGKTLAAQLEHDAYQFLTPKQRDGSLVFALFENHGNALKSGDQKKIDEVAKGLIDYIPQGRRTDVLALNNGNDAEDQIVRAVFGITGYISQLDFIFRPGHQVINGLEAAVIKAATEMHEKIAWRWWGFKE